jgi:hypothetical protein
MLDQFMHLEPAHRGAASALSDYDTLVDRRFRASHTGVGLTLSVSATVTIEIAAPGGRRPDRISARISPRPLFG